MRKYAILPHPDDDTKKIMIYDGSGGAYLFTYTTIEDDMPCNADYCYESLEEAEQDAEKYGITSSDWIAINDPLPNCLHDRVSPIRRKGSDVGRPTQGKYEKLVNGEWVEFDAPTLS